MDTKELFERSSDGFNCDQVEQYITILKAQYKKVFDYAKTIEANNEKLKKICKVLSEENKSLKAAKANVPVAAPAEQEADSGIEKIIRLSKEITLEAESVNSGKA